MNFGISSLPEEGTAGAEADPVGVRGYISFRHHMHQCTGIGNGPDPQHQYGIRRHRPVVSDIQMHCRHDAVVLAHAEGYGSHSFVHNGCTNTAVGGAEGIRHGTVYRCLHQKSRPFRIPALKLKMKHVAKGAVQRFGHLALNIAANLFW